jgi:hypothetical protein
VNADAIPGPQACPVSGRAIPCTTSSRATFGALARIASRGLDAARQARRERAAARPGQACKVARGLEDIVTVMCRYCADITTVLRSLPGQKRTPSPWLLACARARQSMRNAAAFLQADRAGTGRPCTPAGDLAAAAVALAAGRDLLQTHFAGGSDGGRQDRSEWAPVITSPPVIRALLLEVGLWARKTAVYGEQALARSGTGGERPMLSAACQWLRKADWAVRAAHRASPVAVADVELLYAIPANMLPARRLPAVGEPLPGLCQGASDSAERARHAARFAADEAAWSAALTAESGRGTGSQPTPADLFQRRRLRLPTWPCGPGVWPT